MKLALRIDNQVLQLAVGLDPLFTVARWLFAAALALVIVVRGADRLRRVSSVDVA